MTPLVANSHAAERRSYARRTLSAKAVSVPTPLYAKPRRVFVTRSALWFGVVAPPVLALLLSPDVTRLAGEDDFWLRLLRKIFAITLYTNVLTLAQAFEIGRAHV